MRKSTICIGASLVSLALSSAALANEAADPAAQVEATTDESAGLGEILVTARRVSENVQKVPVAVTVVSTQSLSDSTVRGMKDLQGLAPAMFITTGNGGPSTANIAIRGQTQADSLLVTDPSVAVYLNEVNLPRQIGLRAAFLDVDQVQVLKGPQGTLFGKNTTGGALLLRTKRPDLDEAGGYFQGTAGNLGTLQVSGAVGVPIVDGKLGIRLAGQVLSRDGFGRNGIGQKLGDQYDRSARLSLLAEPSDTLTVFLTADYNKSTSNGSVILPTYLRPLAFNPTTGAPLNAMGTNLAQILALQGLPRNTANFTAAYAALQSQMFNITGYNTNGNQKVFAFLELYGFSADASLELGNVTLRSISGYRNTARNDQQDYDQTNFVFIRPRNYVYSEQFTQELQAIANVGDLKLITGGFYSWERGNEGSFTSQYPNVNPASPSSTAYGVTNKSYAGFVQGTYAITDDLHLTGGFRYSNVKQRVDIRNSNAAGCSVPTALRVSPAVCSAVFNLSKSKPSYLVSLDWQVTPDVMVYAKTSSSFRGGGFNVRGGTAAQSTNPYLPFDPEVATDYEVGFKGDLLDRTLRLNLAAYYTDYKDIQKSSLINAGGFVVTVVNNAAKGKIYGGEAELTWQPDEALTFNATGAWTHARYSKFVEANGNDRTKEPFPVPEWQYSLSGKYVVPAGNGDLSLFAAWRWQDDVFYRGTALDQASVSQKAFGLLDGRISYKLDSEPGLEIALFGKNLLNKKYRTNALDFDSSSGYNIAFYGDPRTYGVELKWTFGSR